MPLIDNTFENQSAIHDENPSGGALIDGLDKLIEANTGITVRVAENSVEAVAIGTGEVLKYVSKLDNDFSSREIQLIN